MMHAISIVALMPLVHATHHLAMFAHLREMLTTR